MKKQFLLIIFIFSFLQQSFSQNPLVKQWDKRFGGTDDDWLFFFTQTSDGGYILAGNSWSNISGDKTQNIWGSHDYWIVKTDSLGNKQWDKDFGGTDEDWLNSVQQTVDGGYILGGYSTSDSSGDKTQNAWGFNDYWIVKTDSLSNKQWDKDFGGANLEDLSSIRQTADGGFILGGASNSNISGDKTQNSWGMFDYWIVKTDSLGNKQWDKDFGGTDDDWLFSVQQTADGGYILGGYSKSNIGGDKTQNTWGSEDYWIVKTDSLGNKQWDKNFGGTFLDLLVSIQQTADGGYILGGWSNSNSNGDKTQNSYGSEDYWIVKTDSLGNKQWDKTFGGTTDEDDFGNITQTADGGYLIAGCSYSNIGGVKTENNLGIEQAWIVKTDSLGIMQWDKTILTSGHDEHGLAIQTKDGCYAVGNTTNGGIGGYKTQSNWDPNNFYYDYWIVKFCDTTSTTSITQIPDNPNTFSIYPNPAKESVTINYQFKAGDEIRLTDVLGKLLFTTKIKTPSSDFRLPTSDLSPGIYFIKAGNEVRKFVKE
jgi:hypothetical protein